MRLFFERFVGVYCWVLYRVFGIRALVGAGSSERSVGLNVGSAYRVLGGWVNLDRTIHIPISRITWMPALLYRLGRIDAEQYSHYELGHWQQVSYWDIGYPLPFANNSFDYIYSSHVLEHLDGQVCHQLLTECYRILKPGGWIRLVVPDLYLSASQYVDYMRKMERGDLAKSETVVFLGEQVKAQEITDRFVGQIFESDMARRTAFGHVWMYDHLTLSDFLEKMGFRSAIQMKFREGNLPHLDILDCRHENSLHVEAYKPHTYSLHEGML